MKQRKIISRVLLLIMSAFTGLAGCGDDDHTTNAPALVAPTAFTISGTIAGGVDPSGITVKAGSHKVLTDDHGNYTISGVTNGTYTIIPSKTFYTFTPTTLSVTVSNAHVVGRDFTAHDASAVEMVAVPGGETFTLMGKYEITQTQWLAVMGYNYSGAIGPNLPVEMISWYEAVDFCNKLSQREGLTPCYTIDGTNATCDFTQNGYRLPTEKEWEYACRAGTGTDYYTGTMQGEGGNCIDPQPMLDQAGWWCRNSYGTTHPVGSKQPNTFGLYDMLGNVWEWCWDWYDSTHTFRMMRGGSFSNLPSHCRAISRFNIAPANRDPIWGLRVVRTQ